MFRVNCRTSYQAIQLPLNYLHSRQSSLFGACTLHSLLKCGRSNQFSALFDRYLYFNEKCTQMSANIDDTLVDLPDGLTTERLQTRLSDLAGFAATGMIQLILH